MQQFKDSRNTLQRTKTDYLQQTVTANTTSESRKTIKKLENYNEKTNNSINTLSDKLGRLYTKRSRHG